MIMFCSKKALMVTFILDTASLWNLYYCWGGGSVPWPLTSWSVLPRESFNLAQTNWNLLAISSMSPCHSGRNNSLLALNQHSWDGHLPLKPLPVAAPIFQFKFPYWAGQLPCQIFMPSIPIPRSSDKLNLDTPLLVSSSEWLQASEPHWTFVPIKAF